MIDIAKPYFPLLYVVLMAGFSSCTSDQGNSGAAYVQYVGRTMGTTYSVKHERSDENLQSAIDTALQEVNMALSTYIPESLISRFNRSGELAVPLDRLSEHFRINLEASKQVYELSDGVFDPTVGPLINAWGFGWEGRKPEAPSQNVIDSLLGLVGMNGIEFTTSNDSLYVSAAKAGMIIDLSAIAKGYGVDVVAELLEDKGVDNYFVEIGGEVRTRGVNSSGRTWVVGVSRPETGAAPMDLYTKVGLSGKSMATSGNYRNYYSVEGRQVWHTLDPITGYPEENPVLSASIVYDNCMMADAMATACLVMGAEKCLEFVEAMGGGAYLITRDRNDGTEVLSTGFDNYTID